MSRIFHFRRGLVCLVTALAVSAWAVSSRADLVVVEDTSITHVVDSVIEEAITADDMVGLIVVVRFSDATSETAVWADLGGSSGGVSGSSIPGWSLTNDGNTYFSDWVLTNSTGKTMTEVIIKAENGGFNFDVAYGFLGLEVGTTNSSLGTFTAVAMMTR
jgi:hypothetical protein